MDYFVAPAYSYFRIVFIIILSSLAGPSRGQTLSNLSLAQAPHRFAYTAVVPVAGVSKAELVLRARAWARQVTPASLVPVVASDSDTEIIRTTGVCPFAVDWAGNTLLMCSLRYNATISLREGRYRYEMTDFVFLEPSSGRHPLTETPVETYYNGNFKPYGAIGFRNMISMRTCHKEIADEVIARLQELMHHPVLSK